ncbi:hypothetical protein ACTFIN_04045 [Clostridium cagae]
MESLFYRIFLFILEKMNAIINRRKYMVIPRSEVTIWYNNGVLKSKEK